jgi:type IV pilus secretin PilQ/predicted competence protein
MKTRTSLAWIVAALLLCPAAQADDEAKFTLDYRDARVEDVLRAISAQAGLGFVSSDKVPGTVTLRLKDVTLDEALRYLADATGITYRREGNVLSVNPQGLRARTFTLHYVSATAAKESIARLLSPLGTVDVFTGNAKDDLGTTVGMGSANQLVVRDSDSRLEDVARVIEALDKKPREISIEAKLVEVSLNDGDKMGIDWQIAAHMSGAAMPTTFPFDKTATGGSFTPSTNSVPVYAGSSADFPPGQTFPYAQRGDFTFGTLSASEFKVALDFLSTKNKTNLVSNPKITTMENRQAEILVGTVVPIALYQNSQQTGVLQLSGYEEKKIGVKLTVKPRVSESGEIIMSVHPEISEILEYRGQFNERPVTSTREASTEVRIKDGETLIIGGLVREADVREETKVPFLGDVPVLGEFFKHHTNTKQKVDLVVFVTPHLLPN